MRVKAFSLMMVAALVLAQSGIVLAQGSGWSAVQAVGVDERLIVKQKVGKTIEGKMIEATETNLSITKDNKVVNISRDNIASIEHVKGRAQKTKWAGIGAAAGAGTGAAVGGLQTRSSYDDGEIYVVAGVLLGAGIGAAVGTMIGASRRHRELIYTAP
jgi:hypothetical protein